MTEHRGPLPPRLPESAADPLPSLADQIVELAAISGGLAHEIRNSLSTLCMNLQLLDEDWQGAAEDKGEQRDDQDLVRRSRQRLGTLFKESKRLETILEDFLQFVSKRELNRQPCDLNQLISELVDFYRPQAEAHAIVLNLGPSEESLTCDLDTNLMKQAMLNLLINAQQAMGNGGELTIQVRGQSNRTARIDVIDNGPGMTSQQLSQIFQAYYSTKRRGTGLGLTTTRQIIRELGGRIHVHSEPDNGTCFSILLPRSGVEGE